jgi:surfeit locus 1 family protein
MPRAAGRIMTRATVRAVIAGLAALAVVITAVSLGNWQLRRADEKQRAQAERDAALAQPPQPVAQEPMRPGALDGRQVWVQGYLLGDASIFLDNRTHQGVAGFHVLTPMRLLPAERDDPRGQHVLVLRGWIAADRADRNRLPALRTPDGVVRIEGLGMSELAQPILLQGEAGPPTVGTRLWQRLTVPAYAQFSGWPMQPVIIRQTSELDDGLVRAWVQPGQGTDKHRAYAAQWYALALAAAVMWGLATWRARRRRAEPSGS